MRPDEADDLEALADRELRRLSAPRAPETLLPRVLAAADAWASRPWYSRAWFTWPVGWQAASVGLLAVFVYAAVSVPPAPPSVVAITDAGRAVWNVLIAPFLPYLAAMFVLMCLACAAVGFALNYVLLERFEQ